MDVEAVRAVLEAGKIRELSYADWRMQVGMSWYSFGIPHIAKAISDHGVTSMRWEQPEQNEVNTQGGKIWISYLVVTLPGQPSREVIHEIAVERCRSFFFLVKDVPGGTESGTTPRQDRSGVESTELWIEYQVAKPEVQAQIQSVLEEGKIGGIPLGSLLRYWGASTDLTTIAKHLTARGVVSVHFRPPTEWEAKYDAETGYIVVPIPVSTLFSTPVLPPHSLVSDIATALRGVLHSAWTYQLSVRYEVTETTRAGYAKWLATGRHE